MIYIISVLISGLQSNKRFLPVTAWLVAEAPPLEQKFVYGNLFRAQKAAKNFLTIFRNNSLRSKCGKLVKVLMITIVSK